MTVPQQAAGAAHGSAASQPSKLPKEILSELGRATTAYYEATPDRMEQAREEYREALRKLQGYV